MAPKNKAEFAAASDSEDEKSSASDSDSGSGSGSDSGSGSKSDAESVASKRSSASRSSKSSSVRSGRSARSNQSARSAHSAASAQSARSSRSNQSQEDKNGSRSRSQSRSRSRSGSRSASGTPVQSDSEGDEKLVLDVPKSGSASPMSAKSASSNGSRSSKGSQKKAEGEKKTMKRKHLVLSDDESQSDKEGKSDAEGATAEALFGEAGDISSEDEDRGKKKVNSDDEDEDGGDRKKEKDRSPRDEDIDDEEDKRDNEKEKEPEEVVPETRIEHEIPYIRADVGKEFHFVKLPNFLSVEPRPYDPQTYEDEIDEEETLDEEGRARLKLKVENTIRWRTNFDKEGNAVQESNARMVRWSDGSLSLYLGSEVFDVYRQPLQGDHNHLFIRQGTGLQGQAVFRTKLTFRPHSTDSFTHRKMTLSLADRSQKTSAIKILGTVGSDPEAHRGEMIKKEEERLRASIRRDTKQKRIRERTAAGRSLSGGYLEPDRGGYDDSEDEGGISLSAIKNKYKRGDVRPPIYSSEEDASDIESRKAKKLERAKVIHDSDEDEEAAGSSSKARVVSDDSDEDSD